jgi:hypothetical protein
MFRLTRFVAIVLAAVVALRSVAAADEQDPIETYLELRGFRELLALHLESRVVELSGDERDNVLARLAALYAELLVESEDAADRQRWEARARDVLPRMKEPEASTLQLQLVRAKYVPLERRAEEYRLRLLDEREQSAALSGMRDVAEELAWMRASFETRILQLERTMSRTSGQRAARLSDDLARLRQLDAWSSFYLGWSLYYAGLLSGDGQLAYDSMLAFGELLGSAKGRVPLLVSFPSDQMRFEDKARAAIGVALCQAAQGETTEALRWLDRIEESEDLPDSIAGQLPTRRLIVLGEGRQWAAFRIARERIEAVRELTATEARLITVLALEGRGAPPDEIASREAATAIARLGDLGEIGHVIDLTRRYGTGALGEAGFIPNYVKGLDAYQRARQAHRASGEPEEPTRETAVTFRYRSAIEFITAALDSDEAGRFTEAARSAARRRAMALYYSSRFDEAVDAFMVDASAQSDPQAAESLWFAAEAAGAAATAALGREERTTFRARQRSLISEYLARFPRGSRASMASVRLATMGGMEFAEALDQLLQIPAGDEAYETARRHAARLLWSEYDGADVRRKPLLANSYVDVAMPLLVVDRQRGVAGDLDARVLFVGRARRIAQASLAFGFEDTALARRVLAELDFADREQWSDSDQLRAEILYLWTQVQVIEGDLVSALATVEACRSQFPGSRFAIAATRRAMNGALLIWRTNGAERLDARALTVRLGELLIADFGGLSEAVGPVGPSLIRALAEAYAERGDASGAARALHLFGALIDAGQADYSVFEPAAVLSEQAGDKTRALSYWSEAIRYVSNESEDWYEAKYNALRLLAEADPDAAREAVRQHRVLHPTGGPDPWRRLIDGLADQLGVEHGSEREAEP